MNTATTAELKARLTAVKIGTDAWALLSWRIRCLERPEEGPRFAGHPIAPLIDDALARVEAAPPEPVVCDGLLVGRVCGSNCPVHGHRVTRWELCEQIKEAIKLAAHLGDDAFDAIEGRGLHQMWLSIRREVVRGAVLLVRAVNERADLLAALYDLLNREGRLSGPAPDYVLRARAALARARKGDA